MKLAVDYVKFLGTFRIILVSDDGKLFFSNYLINCVAV